MTEHDLWVDLGPRHPRAHPGADDRYVTWVLQALRCWQNGEPEDAAALIRTVGPRDHPTPSKPPPLLPRATGYAYSHYGVAFDPEGQSLGKRAKADRRWRTLTEQTASTGAYRCLWCGCRLLSQAVFAVLAAGVDGRDFPLGWNFWTDCHFTVYAMMPVADHLWPVTRGGHPTDPRNLVPSCWLCNEARDNALVEELLAEGLLRSTRLKVARRDDFDGGRRRALELWDRNKGTLHIGRVRWPSVNVIADWIHAARTAQDA